MSDHTLDLGGGRSLHLGDGAQARLGSDPANHATVLRLLAESAENQETLAHLLAQTGEYRVLRRMPRDRRLAPPPAAGALVLTGLALDTETTGLGPDAEVVELAMTKFSYSPHTGRIFEVVDAFSQLQQPSGPIPAEVTRVSGITDEDVRGHAIDREAVEDFARDVNFVTAHNARFDRPLVERRWPAAFVTRPWMCSQTEVDWLAHGAESVRLSAVLARAGLFHDAHRASADTLAVIHALAQDVGPDRPALAELLAAGYKTTTVVTALDAPHEGNEALKARRPARYRWNDGKDGRPKAWSTSVPSADAAEEVEFLLQSVYRRESARPLVTLREVNAYNRFSNRA